MRNKWFPILICVLTISCAQQDQTLLADIYITAQNEYLAGDFSSAEKTLLELIDKNQLSPQAPYLLAKIRFMQNRNEESLDILTDILSDYPQHADARLRLARTHLAMGNPLNAEIILKEALKFSAEDPRVLELMASCQEILGHTDLALDYYRRAALFEENMAKIYLSMAALYGQNSMPEIRDAYLDKAESIVSPESLFYDAVQRARESIQ